MRLGRIPYINCYPIYGAIDRGIVRTTAGLVTGTPSELNDLLVAGELDVSVISAVAYARHSKDLVLHSLHQLLSDLRGNRPRHRAHHGRTRLPRRSDSS